MQQQYKKTLPILLIWPDVLNLLFTFFSVGHCCGHHKSILHLTCLYVLGIDSLVRSLKVALQLTNLEVPKQGLLLLTEILER